MARSVSQSLEYQQVIVEALRSQVPFAAKSTLRRYHIIQAHLLASNPLYIHNPSHSSQAAAVRGDGDNL